MNSVKQLLVDVFICVGQDMRVLGKMETKSSVRQQLLFVIVFVQKRINCQIRSLWVCLRKGLGK